mmetsp:Transcript_37557/g.90602  ORF Transcript_37557/g.90602 Transcript_37557/m.90602 type:complete len:99 (+) Transcript_37557:79-375(+)
MVQIRLFQQGGFSHTALLGGFELILPTTQTLGPHTHLTALPQKYSMIDVDIPLVDLPLPWPLAISFSSREALQSSEKPSEGLSFLLQLPVQIFPRRIN